MPQMKRGCYDRLKHHRHCSTTDLVAAAVAKQMRGRWSVGGNAEGEGRMLGHGASMHKRRGDCRGIVQLLHAIACDCNAIVTLSCGMEHGGGGGGPLGVTSRNMKPICCSAAEPMVSSSSSSAAPYYLALLLFAACLPPPFALCGAPFKRIGINSRQKYLPFPSLSSNE